MKILSLDTSSTPVFAAVEVNEWNQIAQARTQVLEQSRQMSRAIISALSVALAEASWSLDDLDAIAVGLGPGSWTGLRVGLSTAKTLAQARELPLIGVPTFDAYALAADATRVCDYCLSYAIAPCRAGEIYCKSWETRDRNMVLHRAERILTLPGVADEITALAPPWSAFIADASGLPAVREITAQLPGYGTEIVEVTPPVLAQNIARLAALRLHKSERDDPLSLAPLYLAPSSAERVRAEKLEKLARKRGLTEVLMTEVLIRAARVLDAADVVRIDQNSFTHPWAPHTMREAIEKAQSGEYIALVAELENRICGFVIAWNVREEGEIATIAVSEKFRGQGIAQQLLKAALHEAVRRGAQTRFLEVRPGNQIAHRLYAKCGFVQVGLRKNYYQNGDDAVIMKWDNA